MSRYTFSHIDLDPERPALGPFETDGARIFLQPGPPVWQVRWEADSAAALVNAIRQVAQIARLRKVTLQVEFVPPEFEADMLREGFLVAGEFVGAWIEDLPGHRPVPPRRYPVRTMISTEVMAAARITYSCQGQLRGYYGKQAEWIEIWAADGNHRIFLAMDGDRPTGVLFAGLDRYADPQGAVCWIREMAVVPSFQNRGLGRELLAAALQWGLNHNATRAFLEVDVHNDRAIHLCQSLGFELRPGRGQIHLQYDIP
jgi:GNAT superfamily N-acetyltransferase